MFLTIYELDTYESININYLIVKSGLTDLSNIL